MRANTNDGEKDDENALSPKQDKRNTAYPGSVYDDSSLGHEESDEEFMRNWEKFCGKNNNANFTQEDNADNTFFPEQEQKTDKTARTPKSKKKIKKVMIPVVIVAILYNLVIFTDIPFIAKWRTIYIETAMSTMDHQWLATAFFPDSLIDEVMRERNAQQSLQDDLQSDWSISKYSSRELYKPWKKLKKSFPEIYAEINQDSFDEYISEHPDEIFNEDKYLVIDEAGLDDDGTDIETVYGDEVLAIDTANAITIVKIRGEGYVGRLAIVKDPTRVGLGLSENFGEKGSQIADLAQYNDAVLAINASGFYDPSGHGNGGKVFGLVIADDKLLNEPLGGTNIVVGFDKKDKLTIGGYWFENSFRDAVEFKPALIVNGEIMVSGSAGWGIQPRSAIGQTKNGEVLLLIVDGRSPGYSIGCTVGELAEIMQRYGAYQAINLDGGSSSIMYYNGRSITRSSSGDKDDGRHIPDGFVVYNR